MFRGWLCLENLLQKIISFVLVWLQMTCAPCVDLWLNQFIIYSSSVTIVSSVCGGLNFGYSKDWHLLPFMILIPGMGVLSRSKGKLWWLVSAAWFTTCGRLVMRLFGTTSSNTLMLSWGVLLMRCSWECAPYCLVWLLLLYCNGFVSCYAIWAVLSNFCSPWLLPCFCTWRVGVHNPSSKVGASSILMQWWSKGAFLVFELVLFCLD